ncbi:MAG: hypothetical protein IT239_06615, partial [Bacteroidia bacterium]|nr:hypothetical protein [Bacteroidia bacterium]
DTLSKKDLKTYQVIDSVGRKAKFDQKLKVAEMLFSNKLQYKFLDFDLDKFLTFNDFEGLRLGLSFNTNKKVSKILSVGAYGALGTTDKAIKYGANLKVNIIPSKKMYLQASFMQDVTETAGLNFYNQGSFLGMGDDLRKILLERLDSIEKYELLLHIKPIQFCKANVYVNQQYRQFTKHYLFYGNNIGVAQSIITEAGAQVYYAYGERTLKFGNFEITEPSNYPVLYFNYAKGFNNLWEGQLKYDRYDVKITKNFKTKFVGRTQVQVAGGYINGNLPYTLLYNGNGSNKRTFSISVNNTFETMRMNEFAANQYASFFITHDFGRLLFKSKYFEPRIAVKFNGGYGSLNNLSAHKNITLTDYKKGYYETGILVNSILKSAFSNMGIGAFYRLGPYSYPNAKNNIVIKLSLGFSF